MVVAGSVLADADAHAWGRLRHFVSWVFVCIGSLAFSEGSMLSFARRLSGHIFSKRRQVWAWWRRGHAAGGALPAPQDLGNLGPVLQNDGSAFQVYVAL